MTKGTMAESKKYKALVQQFKSDKVKNANIIVDFLQFTESGDLKSLKSGVCGLQSIFTELLQDGDIKFPSGLPDDLMTALEIFNNWLYERFKEAHQKLLSLLKHEAAAVPELALSAIIELIRVEGLHPITKESGSSTRFPRQRLQALVDELVSDDKNLEIHIKSLKEHMECQDFMFHVLLSLSTIVKKHRNGKISEVYINNLISMIEQVDIPFVEGTSIICTKLFLDQKVADETADESGQSPPVKVSYCKAKKAINVIWTEIMKYPLNGNLYRRCLILIPEKVVHHLKNPLLLTGFFMEAYDLGGAISLLALQGVFILVNKYNLDYPNFYQKLYSLLEPTIFQAKYRPRFFMLMDRFLASTHVPEYIIAAFIKRLARLSLVAPSSCLILIMKFIANLLIRFPGLQMLIHNPDANAIENDPYDPNELDLSKCRACESSLWEIATLQHHVVPNIAKATAFLEKTLPVVEYDISEFVESTYDEVHERAMKLKIHETVATTFHKPSGLFKHHDDKMSEVWSVV